jgi:hypothetical protein
MAGREVLKVSAGDSDVDNDDQIVKSGAVFASVRDKLPLRRSRVAASRL